MTTRRRETTDTYLSKIPLYGREEFAEAVSKTVIPEAPMAGDSAYRLISDELLLDGRTGLNLATFVNTYEDEWGLRLACDNLGKNFIDHEEYPAANLAEKRSIWMLAKELGTDFGKETDPDTAKGMYGSATIGSSEAVMLGLIAHRYRWQQQNAVNFDKGRADAQDRPIVLMSAHVHTCWHKYCNYCNAMPLFVEIDKAPYTVSATTIAQILDTKIEDKKSPYAAAVRNYMKYRSPQKNRTIGELVMAVGAVVGSTFTGNSDNVSKIGAAIDRYCAKPASKRLKLDIPIHVDAASAGFVLAFSKNGKAVPFDFNAAKRVKSINISNHKYGMSLPGMGSVIFRDAGVVDPSLVYDIRYLGGSFTDYTMNFSRGASMILLQYYNFLRFGRTGYARIVDNCIHNANAFLTAVNKNATLRPLFRNISDIAHLPIVVLTFKSEKQRPSWTLTQLSDELRMRGWIVPAYVLPKTSPEQVLTPSESLSVLRIVVQQKVSEDMLNMLVNDMATAVEKLAGTKDAAHTPPRFAGHRC